MTLPRPNIIFDLDGTLLDSVPDLRIAANKMLAQAGRPELDDEAVKLMVGDGVPKLVERAFAKTGDVPEDLTPYIETFLGFYEDGPMPNTLPWFGIIEALEDLKAAGAKIGVCTNKPLKATLQILDARDMTKYFDGIIGGDSTPKKKPDPTPLLACMEQMGATVETSAMVGDSPNDMAVARNAGIPVVAVSFGYTKGLKPEELGGDILIHHFSELRDALEKL